MFSLGKKTSSFLTLAVIVAFWPSGKKQDSQPYLKDGNLKKFKEISLKPFDVPYPPEQHHIFETVQEVPEPIPSQKSSGQIPSWLQGTLLKNGPGMFEFGEQKASHIFDGMAMMRRYHVDQDQTSRNMSETEVSFSRRMIESDFYKGNIAEGKMTKSGIGSTPEQWGIIDRLKSIGGKGADNVNVATVPLFGHYYAATELPMMVEYDPVTLETLSSIDLQEVIPGLIIMTAHPMYEADGTLWNIGFAAGPDRNGIATSTWRYVIWKVTPPETKEEIKNPWLRLEIVAELPSSKMWSIPYFHSFFMTEHYLIFTEQPWITGDLSTLLIDHIIKGKGIGDTMYWDENMPLYFHIVEKSTGKLHPLKYEADPFGFFHAINAYEEDGNIILDAPFKSTPVSYNSLKIESLGAPPAELQKTMMTEDPVAGPCMRFVLPLYAPGYTGMSRQIPSLGETKAWVVADSTIYLHPEYLAPPSQYKRHRAFEFGVVNPQYLSQKYRFAYGVGYPRGNVAGSIMKLDTTKKKFVKAWEDSKCFATEPIFVPRPGSTKEQDGVVVFSCLGTDRENPTTYFVVLNPDLEELGRFSAPFNTPVEFHGLWISS